MLLRSAMRYYRLWIYSCNGVLLLSVLVFVAVGGCVLSDVRMRFLPLPLYHPTLVYGYIALVLQAGVLQAVGCVSAVRLNERWLNVYWLLMLVLLVGDVLVGVAWVFLFSSLTSSLPSHLRHRLHADYGAVPTAASAQWDRLQRLYSCCGATGPGDYNATQWYSEKFNNGEALANNRPRADDVTNDTWSWTVETELWRRSRIPASCCRERGRVNSSSSSCSVRGCVEPIRTWVQRSADQLFVIGYCVIAFLKLCFLGILRYEIREMIHKIRLLQGELQGLPDLATIGLPPLSPNHVMATSPSSPASKAAMMMAPNGNNNDLEMKELPPPPLASSFGLLQPRHPHLEEEEQQLQPQR